MELTYYWAIGASCVKRSANKELHLNRLRVYPRCLRPRLFAWASAFIGEVYEATRGCITEVIHKSSIVTLLIPRCLRRGSLLKPSMKTANRVWWISIRVVRTKRVWTSWIETITNELKSVSSNIWTILSSKTTDASKGSHDRCWASKTFTRPNGR